MCTRPLGHPLARPRSLATPPSRRTHQDKLERAVKHFGNTRYDYATPEGVKDPEVFADTAYRANDHECYSSCVWEPCQVHGCACRLPPPPAASATPPWP